MTMTAAETISASEFKAKRLEMLDLLSKRKLERLVITKRGRPVAFVLPPSDDAEAVESLYGFMEGSVLIPDGYDLTAPVLHEELDSEAGTLHR
jgi:antitoxin (DNA-binding transcriptional repressor) of toxin-antitoxin stability system